MKKRVILGFLAMLALLSAVRETQAQITIWNDSAGDSFWSNGSNWSAGVPTATSSVQIGNGSNTGVVGVDTNVNVTVASFAFNNTLANTVQVLPGNTEQLTVNGVISNNSSFQQDFGLTVNAGANATYTGGSGGLLFSFLNVNTKSISTVNTLTVASGGQLVFDINSLASFGSIGSITTTGVHINIAGTYTGSAGDSFDLTSGNFTGASLDSTPTLGAGLSWNTSQFFSTGQLTVVAAPEPGSASLLILGGCGLFLARRLFKRKIA